MVTLRQERDLPGDISDTQVGEDLESETDVAEGSVWACQSPTWFPPQAGSQPPPYTHDP